MQNIAAQRIKIPYIRLPNGPQVPKTPGSQIYLPSHVILPSHIPGVIPGSRIPGYQVRLLRNATTPSTVVPNILPSQGAQVLQTSRQQMLVFWRRKRKQPVRIMFFWRREW